MNVFYVSIRTTENYEFDKIRTAGVTGNATNKNSQGDNSTICSTRDEISQPFRAFSPRAATGSMNNPAFHAVHLKAALITTGDLHVLLQIRFVLIRPANSSASMYCSLHLASLYFCGQKEKAGCKTCIFLFIASAISPS